MTADYAWVKETLEVLVQLLGLKENWISGAPPISPVAVLSAVAFLLENAPPDIPQPQVFPTSIGGVALEWHTHGVDIEIVFDADGIRNDDLEVDGVERKDLGTGLAIITNRARKAEAA